MLTLRRSISSRLQKWSALQLLRDKYDRHRIEHKRYVAGLQPENNNDLRNYANCVRQYSSTNQSNDNRGDKSSQTLPERVESSRELNIGQKVTQTTKDVYYIGVIIIGIGVTGIMFYAIFRELFSKQSPNNIYSDALKLCKDEPRVVDALGEPLKGYGKTTARGRRRHPSFVEYVQDGVNYLRMKFYIEGIRRKGTVHLEMKENEEGRYEYRYLFVELNDFPRETIIIKDNR